MTNDDTLAALTQSQPTEEERSGFAQLRRDLLDARDLPEENAISPLAASIGYEVTPLGEESVSPRVQAPTIQAPAEPPDGPRVQDLRGATGVSFMVADPKGMSMGGSGTGEVEATSRVLTTDEAWQARLAGARADVNARFDADPDHFTDADGNLKASKRAEWEERLGKNTLGAAIQENKGTPGVEPDAKPFPPRVVGPSQEVRERVVAPMEHHINLMDRAQSVFEANDGAIKAKRLEVWANTPFAQSAGGRSMLQSLQIKDQQNRMLYKQTVDSLGGAAYNKLPDSYRDKLNGLYNQGVDRREALGAVTNHYMVDTTVSPFLKRIGDPVQRSAVEDYIKGTPKIDPNTKKVMMDGGDVVRNDNGLISKNQFGLYTYNPGYNQKGLEQELRIKAASLGQITRAGNKGAGGRVDGGIVKNMEERKKLLAEPDSAERETGLIANEIYTLKSQGYDAENMTAEQRKGALAEVDYRWKSAKLAPLTQNPDQDAIMDAIRAGTVAAYQVDGGKLVPTASDGATMTPHPDYVAVYNNGMYSIIHRAQEKGKDGKLTQPPLAGEMQDLSEKTMSGNLRFRNGKFMVAQPLADILPFMRNPVATTGAATLLGLPMAAQVASQVGAMARYADHKRGRDGRFVPAGESAEFTGLENLLNRGAAAGEARRKEMKRAKTGAAMPSPMLDKPWWSILG